MACVTSASFSVLVNGVPNGHFNSSRGLRQGCPLSPYLFILCSEALTRLVEYKESLGVFKGLKVNNWAPSISHLLFADDLFFFGNASMVNVVEVKNILKEYEEWSGQAVNFSKSSIFLSPNLDKYMQSHLINLLGVKAMEKNDKYLGNSLLLPLNQVGSYNDLITKCLSKLSGWKSRVISHAGRTVLIKAALASIPIYNMSTYMVPKEIIKEMTKVQRQFWWGAAIDQRRIYYTAWKHMKILKHLGGLGIRDLGIVNLSLVAKLAYRMLTNPSSVWGKLLAAKYLHLKDFWTVTKTQNSSKVWQSIMEARDVLKQGCCWAVCLTSTVKVWTEPWVPSVPGFRVEGRPGKKELINTVSDLIDKDTRTWRISLVKECFEDFEAAAILKTPINSELEEDRLVWTKAVDGGFSTKSIYRLIQDNKASSSSSVLEDISSFNWSFFWKVRGVAPRVLMFLWRVLHRGIAVHAETARRLEHMDPVCRWCCAEPETIDHALLHCSVVKMCWFSSPLGLVDSFDSLDVKSLFTNLSNNPNKEGFKMACFLIWEIWKSRCGLVFKRIPFDIKRTVEAAMASYNEYKPSGLNEETSTTLEMVSNSVEVHRWRPPEQGFFSICIDGACKDNQIAGAAVIRDDQGNFIAGRTQYADFGVATDAEALALQIGLDLLGDHNITQCIIESDCQAMVKGICDNKPVNWRIQHILDRARSVIRSDTRRISIRFLPRSANKLAHLMATNALNSKSCNSWSIEDQPSFLNEFVEEDV